MQDRQVFADGETSGKYLAYTYNELAMTTVITLPGLIDPHVHLRDPGQTHKEDFFSGTSAALAGGFTVALDMPNNAEPITTLERLKHKIASAKTQAVSDLGFYFGTLGDNFTEFPKAAGMVMGLKVYLNATTGNFIIDKAKLRDIYEAWPGTKPILLHAEDDVSDLVWETLLATRKPTHICHVSSQAELELVIRAKEAGLPMTCGVTPHHLFLTNKDIERLGAFGHMKPLLKPQQDQDFLWSHLDYIDVVESDHAPHTRQEKEGNEPPFGVPGLETTLPLLLTAEAQGKLTRKQLIDRLHNNTARIFSITTDDTTRIDVDMNEYVFSNEGLHTKAGWSPFAGTTVIGKVVRVVLRGQPVYENGHVLAKPGSGHILP